MTKGRCICEICNCGRHRCPHVPTNILGKGDRPCQLTEYANVYKPHAITARENFKPNPQPYEGGKFEEGTTHRKDYIQHAMEPHYVHQAEQYHQPEGEMDKTTSYKQDYPVKHGPRAMAIKNEGQRMLPAKFEGEPTYRADYKQWEGGRQPGYASQAQWVPPTDTFGGQTTFQHDYKRNEIQPRQSYKPNEGAKMSDTPFDGQTTHGNAYQPHAIPPKYVREREVYKPTGAPMDGSTTNKRDYQGARGTPMRSFKPDNQAFSSGAPLEDTTTFKDAYKKWPASRPYHHLPETYRKPEGEMQMDTTHKQAYKEMPFSKVQAVRPVSANRGKDVPFEGTTNYSQDYRKWEADRVTVPKKDDYVPNLAPFDGSSTYKHHYVPLPVGPARSFRPDNQAFHSDSELQNTTIYKDHYTKKEIVPCPAAVIDQSSSRYRFQEVAPSGHRFYAMTTITPLGGTGGPSQSQQRLAMSMA